jgi:hypothetical protein
MKALQGEWPDHVRAWRRSGVTAQAYCAKRGLNVNTLRSWSARMQDEKRGETTPVEKAGAELRMALVRPARPVAVATSEFPSIGSGVRLRVGTVCVEVAPGLDVTTMAQVVDVLEQRGAAR